MAPTLWLAFVFFGIPLILGLLGLLHSGRLLYRGYRRKSRPQIAASQVPAENHQDTLSRGKLIQYGLLLLGSALLVVHSGRWLLRIYGVL